MSTKKPVKHHGSIKSAKQGLAQKNARRKSEARPTPKSGKNATASRHATFTPRAGVNVRLPSKPPAKETLAKKTRSPEKEISMATLKKMVVERQPAPSVRQAEAERTPPVTKTRKEPDDGIPKAYDAAAGEALTYERWESSGVFAPNAKAKSGRRFTVLMPPPNVTGKLHLGHAMANTMEDAMVRYHRMKGDEVLFLPGTDHAGISTQVVVEKHLAEEGKTREGLGREKFIDAVWQWKGKYHAIITDQIRRLGVSCDWKRERFTLDSGLSRAVKRAFVALYEQDLVYKGNRIVNWCPRCQTVLSDMEVVYREEVGKLYMIRYFVKAADKSIVVATARPETLLGDTAVAVHPEDKRYKEFIGKQLILPIINREIPIIADTAVEMDFGTGAVKVTPAHSEVDYAMALRHDLPVISVIAKDGKMAKNTGKFAGLSVEQARENIIGYLDNIGNLEGEKELPHNVAFCERCDTKLEPYLSPQWFVRMRPLAEKTMAVMKKEQLEFVPERFAAVFDQWLANVHDWCISRQLWWGHRIPAFTCKKCAALMVSEEPPDKCRKCKSKELLQEEDVLDTWFSSALWPFSTMGWPSRTEDLRKFFPSSVLETGYDIIFFWVIRMVFMSVHFMGRLPFSAVYMHGLVRDEHGRKMSKSLGNGVDPMEVIDQYGADALRLSLVVGHTPGNDMRFSIAKVESERNFVNKLWNASRFIRMAMAKPRPYNALRSSLEKDFSSLSVADRWILSELSEVIRGVTESFDKHAYGEAADTLREFVWKRFCDWYIEIAKTQRAAKGDRTEDVLSFVLLTALKLLHPFAPFVTERIWSSFFPAETLAVSEWPTHGKKLSDGALADDMRSVLDLIHGIRNLRMEQDLPPSALIDVTVVAVEKTRFVESQRKTVSALARIKEFKVVKSKEGIKSTNFSVVGKFEIMMLIADKELRARNAEKNARLMADKQQFIAKLEAQLRNKGFVKNAKPAVLEQTKKRLEEEKAIVKKLKG